MAERLYSTMPDCYGWKDAALGRLKLSGPYLVAIRQPLRAMDEATTVFGATLGKI